MLMKEYLPQSPCRARSGDKHRPSLLFPLHPQGVPRSSERLRQYPHADASLPDRHGGTAAGIPCRQHAPASGSFQYLHLLPACLGNNGGHDRRLLSADPPPVRTGRPKRLTVYPTRAEPPQSGSRSHTAKAPGPGKPGAEPPQSGWLKLRQSGKRSVPFGTDRLIPKELRPFPHSRGHAPSCGQRPP